MGPVDRKGRVTMATTRFEVFANLYKDSVTLMQLGAKLRERDGIEQASCLMATPANLAQLQDADLSIDTQASPSDLLVVVRGDSAACSEAIAAARDLLYAKGGGGGAGGGAGGDRNAAPFQRAIGLRAITVVPR